MLVVDISEDCPQVPAADLFVRDIAAIVVVCYACVDAALIGSADCRLCQKPKSCDALTEFFVAHKVY